MYVIKARNVNDAYFQGLQYLQRAGERADSRNGPVLLAPGPVITEYAKPTERVLFDEQRDANPFFHLVEALWMLAGRNDVALPAAYAKQIAVYAEPDGRLHGAYGYRWLHHFDVEGGGHRRLPNQLAIIVEMLRSPEPIDRRAVLTMWDPVADLGANEKRDLPCNSHVYFRIYGDRLDMTVCCRSNDAIWGAYGANAVHFSVLHEYIAAKVGLVVGRYYQMSNNFHAYLDVFAKVQPVEFQRNPYEDIDMIPHALMGEAASFDFEVKTLLAQLPNGNILWAGTDNVRNRFLAETVYPMLKAHMIHKRGDTVEAIARAEAIAASDWRLAATRWLRRRLQAKERKAAHA